VAAEASESIVIPRGDPETTVAAEGETLEDVAERVYGSRRAVETLIRANRGLASRRGPLRAGSVLWTPPR
jgi:phage tail protein X